LLEGTVDSTIFSDFVCNELVGDLFFNLLAAFPDSPVFLFLCLFVLCMLFNLLAAFPDSPVFLFLCLFVLCMLSLIL